MKFLLDLFAQISVKNLFRIKIRSLDAYNVGCREISDWFKIFFFSQSVGDFRDHLIW